MSLKRTRLERRTPLKRGQGLNPVGKKARKDHAELAKVRPEVLARGCEFTAYLHFAPASIFENFTRPVPITCAGQLDPHHAVKRSQGGSNHPTNLICLCRRHHDFTEHEPTLCREIGLLR